MIAITFSLKQNQSLFHGSPTLFDPPYLPRNIENRFSYNTDFPLYYATKSCSVSPDEGYLYEYKISDWAKKEYGGIPEFLFLQGNNIHEAMEHYIAMMIQEPVIHSFTDDEIRRNTIHEFETTRTNPSQNDLELACICRTKYNGIYVPKYENQILICGSRRHQWLEISNIFKAVKGVKGVDGKITTTMFKSFPTFISTQRPHTPITAPESWNQEKSEGTPLSLSEIFGDDIFKNSSSPTSSVRKRDRFVPVHTNDERKEGESEILTSDVWEQICTVTDKTSLSNGKAEYRKNIQIKVDVPTTTPLLPKPFRITDGLPVGSVFKQSRLKQKEIFSDENEWPTQNVPVWTVNDQNRWSSGTSYNTDSWKTESDRKKKWNDKDIDRFDDEVHTGVDPIVKFYRNEAVNKARRRLSTIWNWSDEKLESQHDFIQWIFPMIEKSRFNYDAPVLTKRSIEILRSDKEIQANIKVSFDKMFAFYGWKVNETLDGVERMTIDIEKDGETEKKLKPMEWLRHSHNFDRITRIMTSLKLMGRTDLSELFFMALCRTAKGPTARKLIASSFIEYWLPTQEHFLPTNVLEAYCTDITERRKTERRKVSNLPTVKP